MDHRRWLGMSLEQRYASLHGESPRPVDEPAAAVSLPIHHAAPTEEEREEQAHNLRTALALIAIEQAEREQTKEVERERRVIPGALGALMRGA
jgi:hypothetical protein